MNEYSNFTSLAPQDEAALVVFERTTQENLHKAMMIGLVSGIGILLVSLVIFFGFSPPEKKHAPEAPSQTKTAPAEKPAAAPTP